MARDRRAGRGRAGFMNPSPESMLAEFKVKRDLRSVLERKGVR